MSFLFTVDFQSEVDTGISLRSNAWRDKGQNRGDLCLEATGLSDTCGGSIYLSTYPYLRPCDDVTFDN